MLIENMEIDFDILDDAVGRCLPGFVGESWVEFEADRPTRVRTTYELRQEQLGSVGCVIVLKRGDKLSALQIDEPATPKFDEAIDHFGRLNPEAQDKIDLITNLAGQVPPQTLRAMIIFGLVDPRQIEFGQTQDKDHNGQPILHWKLQLPTELSRVTHKEANAKVSEWRAALHEKRKIHHGRVLQALFNRLYAEDIWPRPLLFPGTCKESKRLVEDIRTLVVEHMPPEGRERSLFNGSVEAIGDPPRKVLILADTHGAGRLVIGHLAISPFPNATGEFDVKCYGKTMWRVMDWTHGLFVDLFAILGKPADEIPSNTNIFQPGSQPVIQIGPKNVYSGGDIVGRDKIEGA